ncbi:f6744649-b106-4c95-a689-1b3e3d2dea6c [Sclerotinia trifoliorum]|uniref:F6744649-b106-4c95-a689-1b3e3d2dea6c n=1 Tax=Sclerotinia trifoliorum TaxID=28548 RepID=A0A8H2ZVA7_9HELO|nr:f6744649-b106-4c95-a689-1b3e3d2dea6c [Sclerotinia trifoliorum]
MMMLHRKSHFPSHFHFLAKVNSHPIKSFIICQQYRPISIPIPISISNYTPKAKLPFRSLTTSSPYHIKKSIKMDSNPNSETVIAIGQLCSTSNIEQNLLTCQKLAQEASEQGAKALFLPEATDYITTPGCPHLPRPRPPNIHIPLRTRSPKHRQIAYPRYQRRDSRAEPRRHKSSQ